MASSTQPGCRVRTAPSIDLPLRSVVPRRSSTGSVSGVPEPPSARPEAVPEAVDEAVGEADLFEVPPERFIATRDPLVKQLRADGRKADAARVAKRRRPPLTAWALNQVARRSPEQLDAWRDAGAQLAPPWRTCWRATRRGCARVGQPSGPRSTPSSRKPFVVSRARGTTRTTSHASGWPRPCGPRPSTNRSPPCSAAASWNRITTRRDSASMRRRPLGGAGRLGARPTRGRSRARAPGPLSGDASTDEPGPMTTDRPETVDLVERRNQAEQAAQQNDQRALSLRSEADGLRAEAERLGSEAERLAAEVERLRAESARPAAAVESRRGAVSGHSEAGRGGGPGGGRTPFPGRAPVGPDLLGRRRPVPLRNGGSAKIAGGANRGAGSVASMTSTMFAHRGPSAWRNVTATASP